MRIFYFVTKTEQGGAQTYLWNLAKYAKEKGDEVFLMADKEGWLSKKFEELGFQFIPNKYYKNSWSPINLLLSVIKTRKAIEKINPDIIHANSGGAGFFVRLASIGLSTKVVFTAHGWSFTEGAPFLRRQIAILAENIVLPLTDAIVCVSENDARLARKYLNISASKISVVHNGTPMTSDFAKPGRNFPIKILFAGRLARPKLPIAILRALSSVPKEIKEKFSVLIAGAGKQKKYLKHFAKENNLNVTIEKVPTELMHNKYLDSDIFILPTEWEGFPMTIIEAMMAGVPTVASNVGGIGEAVNENVGELLRRGREEIELESLFKKIASDTKWIQVRGDNARRRAIELFSSDLMCERTWNIYGRTK